ncbi:hypothetical protein FPV67DRAFT_280715 [Lyophyllum atratum]|nr:hypothetical protein FPV67DRAFT_280715 [Lyophyllum atratum]
MWFFVRLFRTKREAYHRSKPVASRSQAWCGQILPDFVTVLRPSFNLVRHLNRYPASYTKEGVYRTSAGFYLPIWVYLLHTSCMSIERRSAGIVMHTLAVTLTTSYKTLMIGAVGIFVIGITPPSPHPWSSCRLVLNTHPSLALLCTGIVSSPSLRLATPWSRFVTPIHRPRAEPKLIAFTLRLECTLDKEHRFSLHRRLDP